MAIAASNTIIPALPRDGTEDRAAGTFASNGLTYEEFVTPAKSETVKSEDQPAIGATVN